MSAGRAFAINKPNMGEISSGALILELKVPDGRWAVFAKLNVELSDATFLINAVNFKFGPVGGTPLNGSADENQAVLTINSPTACLSFEQLVDFPGSDGEPNNAVMLKLEFAVFPVKVGRVKIIAVEADTVHE